MAKKTTASSKSNVVSKTLRCLCGYADMKWVKISNKMAFWCECCGRIADKNGNIK